MSSRCIGLDVHRDFCEVAIWEAGKVRSAGRVATRAQALAEFAALLGPGDEVALEATSGARQVADILRPHVARRDRQHPPAGSDLGVEEEDRSK